MINTKRLKGLICLIMIFSASCNSKFENKSPEEKIVSFVLNSIIKVDKLKVSALILYGPLIKTSADVISVDKDHLYHVWWSEGGKLLDKGNSPTTITDFYKLHDVDYDVWEIGFSVIFTDASKNEAEIYLEELCGITCGEGTKYGIHLNKSNQWEIKDEETLWIS